jgi:hypothetical protein
MNSPPRVRYADMRPYLLPETLDELAGPDSGVIRLPVTLDWSEQHVYDLNDDADRRLMYERVIREAMDVGTLRTFLNRELLTRVWPRLFLPARVKLAWESRFPALQLTP